MVRRGVEDTTGSGAPLEATTGPTQGALDETTGPTAAARPLDETTGPRAGPERRSLLEATAQGLTRSFAAAKTVAQGSLTADERIGRFTVLRELGRGAMGIVFLAYDEELDRKVALKLVHIDDTADSSLGRNQLLREAQALARLTHPNVVAVFEAGVHRGGVFLAMEYVEGVDLQRWQTAARRPWREIVAVFLQAGAGLQAAHKVGLIHRDFKPSNVLVGADGRTRVADFGLAAQREQILGAASDAGPLDSALVAVHRSQRLSTTIAAAGALVGTPAYMAPEQFRREAATALSDQFAFCVALYESLYGVRPFVGETLDSLAQRVMLGQVSAAAPDPTVPAWLHALVLRGLSLRASERFPDMGALLVELARDPEAERRRQRQRLLQLTAAVVATLAVVLGGTAIYRAVARALHEGRAEARLAVVREQIAGLRARGLEDEARQVFETFVGLSDNQGTAAIGRAYRDWGAAQRDHAAAIDAFAAAYAQATDPADRTAALRELTLRLAARGDLDAATVALETIEAAVAAEGLDPELARVRLDASLHRRDLAGAAAALELLDPSDDARSYGQVLRNLSEVTEIPARALGRTPDQRHWMRLGDHDGDGRPEVITAAPALGGDAALVLEATPTLPVRAELRVPPLAVEGRAEIFKSLSLLPLGPGGEPRLWVSVINPGGQQDSQHVHALLPLTPGAAPELSWVDSPGVEHAADLDRDGEMELYFGAGAYSRHLVRATREPGGGWRREPAHAKTDAARSDTNSIVSGDLDGDGAPELVIALGAWRAYDVRVLRADASGGLTLAARRTFGHVSSLGLARMGDKTRIVAVKRDEYASQGRFPEGGHFGAPPGIYILELAGQALEVVQFVPTGPLAVDEVQVFDLDGDGIEDLMLRDVAGIMLLQGTGDRFRAPLVLGGLHAVLVGSLDEDPAAEIVAYATEDTTRYFVLGAGASRLPPLPRRARGSTAPRVEAADPAIAAVWRRAEDLAELGLSRRAAEELVAIAGLAGAAREDLWLRAGQLYRDAGDHEEAAVRFEAAAVRADLAAEALGGAVAARRAQREFAAAAALAEARAALPDLSPETRTEAEAEARVLRRAGASRPELKLRFDGTLDPRWAIFDPLAFARDLGTNTLRVQSSAETVLAELPLEWDGGSVGLAIEATPDYLEWGSSLEVSLAPAGSDEDWLRCALRADGSTESPTRTARLSWGRGDTVVTLDHVLPPGSRARLEWRHDPELDAALAEIWLDGRKVARQVLPAPGVVRVVAPRPGPVRLQVASRGVHPQVSAQIRLHQIELAGFRAQEPVGPVDAAARQIAEGELGEALKSLAAESTGARGMWRAYVLARLGRADEAASVLDGVLKGGGQDVRLVQRLRHDPDAFYATARRVLGDELYEIVRAHLQLGGMTRPKVVRQLLDDLELHTLTPPPPGDAEADSRHCTALVLRAKAWRSARRPDLARRDFEAVWSVLGDSSRIFPLRDDLWSAATLGSIELAIEAGDLPRARRWLEEIARASKTPEITLEVWRDHPWLGAQIPAEEWERLTRGGGS